MIQILFIIIAFALRHKFLPEDAPVLMKVFYYGANAVISPLLALPFFKWINSQLPSDSDEPNTNIFANPLLF